MTEPWGDNWLLTYLVACRSAPGGAGKSRSKQRSCEVCLAQGSAESEDALTGVRSHEGLGEAEWRQQTELPEKNLGRRKGSCCGVFDVLGAEPPVPLSCSPSCLLSVP